MNWQRTPGGVPARPGAEAGRGTPPHRLNGGAAAQFASRGSRARPRRRLKVRRRTRRCSQVSGSATATPALAAGGRRARPAPVSTRRARPGRTPARGRMGSRQRGPWGGGRDVEDPPLARRPDDHEGPAEYGVLGDRPAAGIAHVVAGVVRKVAVVPHDPEPARRDHDVEPGQGGSVARVQVRRFGQREPSTVTWPSASQQATWSPGSPMTRSMCTSPGWPKPNRRRGRPELLEDVPFRDRARVPGPIAVEDDEIAAINPAKMVNDLIDQDPVTDPSVNFHRVRTESRAPGREGLAQGAARARARSRSARAARARELPALVPACPHCPVRRPGPGLAPGPSAAVLASASGEPACAPPARAPRGSGVPLAESGYLRALLRSARRTASTAVSSVLPVQRGPGLTTRPTTPATLTVTSELSATI